MRIPDSVIDAIRERVDIVQVVGRFVPLKRAGRSMVGLCPFHSEKSPSFNVTSEKKIYYCFGCGEGGDVFKFLTKHTHKAFPEVVKELGREVGIEVQEREETPQEREAERQKTRLHAILELAYDVYSREITTDGAADARAYLQDRGFSPTDLATYEIGYGGAGWDLLWKRLGGDKDKEEDLQKAGLCVLGERGPYDRFAGRIVFPIRDDKLRIIGFGGRVFGERAKRDGVAKYVNTSESAVYDKSSALYRLPQALQKARKGAPMVVVEGYFDALALERCGLAVVATCGTALTARHGQTLQKSAQKVVLCWDGDAAGERAVQRAANVLLPLHVDTRVAVLPIGDDPDTYVARVGTAGAQRLVDEAEALPTFVIAQTARNAEDAGEDVRARADAIRSLKWLFAALPSALEKEMYLRQAAERLGIQPAALSRELSVVVSEPRSPPSGVDRGNTRRPAPPPPRAQPPRRREFPADLLAFYGFLFEHPGCADPLLAQRFEPTGADLFTAGRMQETLKLVSSVAAQFRERGSMDLDALERGEFTSKHLTEPALAAVWAKVRAGPPIYPDVEDALRRYTLWLRRRALDQRLKDAEKARDDAQDEETRRNAQNLVVEMRTAIRMLPK